MKEKISLTEVEHVAKLARIELSASERKKFQQQMATILDYIDKINEVDTEKVEPTWQVTGLENVQRPDKAHPFMENERLIDAAPDSQDQQVKVKGVFKT
jgi:aspartyl-tRNA(Asn)/glutamyl-tRNA(Gln) amidotransferase subunit C